MPSHALDELVVVESSRQSENRIERKNPHFVFMVPIGRPRSAVETGDIVSESLTYEAVFPLDKAHIGTARILRKTTNARVDIGNEPMKPAEPSYRNRIVVLHDKRETLGPLGNTRP